MTPGVTQGHKMQALPFGNIQSAREAQERHKEDKEQAPLNILRRTGCLGYRKSNARHGPTTLRAGRGRRNIDGKGGEAFRLTFRTALDL